MTRKQFFLTEVFAEAPYGGNPLATLVDAADISGAEMQQIARAFNLSETTFLLGGDQDTGFDVRIFTPVRELSFAGHPTLGSACLIRSMTDPAAASITLNLAAGQIPVTFGADGVCWMKQLPPSFRDSVGQAEVDAVVGLAAGAIDQRFPCQRVSTGVEFLLVPLTSAAHLAAIEASAIRYDVGILAFCATGYDPGQAISARMFAPALGLTEDPATGSAAGCLAGYLVEHNFFGTGPIDLRIGQGYEIARPSQLYLRAARVTHGIDVNVGGKVRVVAEGHWQL